MRYFLIIVCVSWGLDGGRGAGLNSSCLFETLWKAGMATALHPLNICSSALDLVGFRVHQHSIGQPAPKTFTTVKQTKNKDYNYEMNVDMNMYCLYEC